MRLRQRLDEGLEALRATGKLGALLLIDLDRFKEVNDTLGHQVGDRLLARVSQRLALEMRAYCGGEVARLGGDEFAIWVEGFDDEITAEAAAARALCRARGAPGDRRLPPRGGCEHRHRARPAPRRHAGRAHALRRRGDVRGQDA